MKQRAFLSAWFLGLASLSLLAGEYDSRTSDWPTTRVELGLAMSNATTVAVAISTNPASVFKHLVAHISTGMALGDGQTVNGGGMVTYAYCRQEFSQLEVLYGKKLSEPFVLEYGFIEKSDAFPGPRIESAIPANQKVILILSDTNALLKVLQDTEANRRMVKEMHNKGAAGKRGIRTLFHTDALAPRCLSAVVGRLIRR